MGEQTGKGFRELIHVVHAEALGTSQALDGPLSTAGNTPKY